MDEEKKLVIMTQPITMNDISSFKSQDEIINHCNEIGEAISKALISEIADIRTDLFPIINRLKGA